MRMQKLVLILIMLTFAGSLSAQSGWQWLNPQIAAGDNNCIEYVNQNTIWVGQSSGGLLKTTNGGLNWVQYSSNQAFNIKSLCFLNEFTGWAVGGNGKIIKTTNSGINWIVQSSGVNSSLNCIKFNNSTNGAICGDNLTILTTTNSGSNWTIKNYFANNGELKSINFFDSLKTIIVGTSDVFKTNNGGINWIHISTNANDFRSASFTDTLNGWAATGQYVVKTTNLGANWFTISTYLPNTILTSVHFLNNNIGYACGTNGAIYKTINGGGAWTGISYSPNEYNLFIQFKDSLNGIVVGKNGSILNTTNRGTNWASYNSRFTSINLKKILCIDSNIIWVCGEGGVYQSTNGGINWVNRTTNSYTAYSIYFKNSLTGWLSYRYFAPPPTFPVYKTTNGGNSWNYFNNQNGKFTFVNELTGWFAGNVLKKTDDGGITWFSLTSPGPELNDLYFVNDLTGWIIGGYSNLNEDKIYKTTDGGAGWSSQTTNQKYSCIQFIDANTGWISGSNFLKTTNGGETWYQLNSVGNVLSFKFLNENTGWYVNTVGQIYKSNNGGINWLEVNIYYNGPLNSVDFIDLHTGFIAGDNGAILKTTDGGGVFVSETSSFVPDNFSLSQNYPNPFNPSTKINYEIKSSGFVSLKVFDLLGKEVAMLVNEKQNAGSYAIDFNSTEFNLPSGVYFYTLNAGEFKETKKMVLVK